MLNTKENMSALEWFFRNKPSASNFPQDTSSSELRQLYTELEQLSIALSSDGSIAEGVNLSSFFGEWVGKVSALGKPDKTQIASLIQKVDEVIQLIKLVSESKVSKNIVENLKATLIALVILAKTSPDVKFRNQVIRLAKNLNDLL